MTKPRKSDSGLWAVDIDGHTYEWEKWGAEDALDTLTEIMDLIGKPLGGLVSAIQSARGGADVPLASVMTDRIVSGMLRKMKRNKADVKTLFRKLTSGQGVFCDGKPIVFNSHYEDRLHHMLKVANKAIEVQYGSFLDAVLAALGDNQAKARAANENEATSTTSGGTFGRRSSRATAH